MRSFVLVLSLSAAALTHAQGPPQRGFEGCPTEMVCVDGATAPEKIPDWMTTGHALSTLGVLARHYPQSGAPTLLLTLSDADRRLAFEAGRKQAEREAQCVEAQRPYIDASKQPEFDEKTVAGSWLAVIVTCRQRDLDAWDALLDAVSPEGRASLAAWWLEKRRKVMAVYPQSEAAMNRLPR